MKINPLGERVLIEPIEEEISSVIIAPDGAAPKPVKGRVRNVGPAVVNVCIGDIVLFGKYSGTEVPIDRKRSVVLMLEAEVLATVEED
jgi:chaperonin GroES